MAMLLTTKLRGLLRERSLDRQLRLNQIRVARELPYPLDAETAAAIEAAKQHHVLTWEDLEDGDDIGEWVRDSFLVGGKTALPDGAYGLASETKPIYVTVPTEAEVKELFEDEESFQKFLAGEDYSYGLADVPDAEYDAHYEAVVSAIKGIIQPGTVVNLPTVPHAFLREAPLVDGEWIDRFIVELAEWGARIEEKGLLLDDSGDHHPIAWQRIIDPEDAIEVDAGVVTKLWQQTRKHLARFPGRTRDIEGRPYLSFEDYLRWRGRRAKGDLTFGIHTGLAVVEWNQWVERYGGEGAASLGGVKVSKLDCYLVGYRYRVCRDATELAEEVSQRESLLKSLQIGKSDGKDDERFRRRVEHWKELALGFLPEIYALHRAIDSISQRYFDGQQTLFPSVAEGFEQLSVLVEKTVGIYNEHLAGEIERLEKLLIGTGDGQDESPLTVDLAGLIENVQGATKGQVAYLVDMAKADALDMLGEAQRALELVDRHVSTPHPKHD